MSLESKSCRLSIAGRTILVLSLIVLAGCGREEKPSGAAPAEALRGEPINPAPASAASSPTGAPPVVRKKYPKPVSFQRRMVEYHASRTNGAVEEPMEGFPTSAAKVRYTREQLESRDDPGVPSGYEWLGFSRLSGFPFEVTPTIADGSTNLASASQSTRSKIPETVRVLDGHPVAIRGFLIPLRMDEGLAVEFLLMRDQNLCCYGTVPKVNEWILVRAEGRGVKPVMDQPITVMGRLHVGEVRENGYLTGIYRIDADRINGPGG